MARSTMVAFAFEWGKLANIPVIYKNIQRSPYLKQLGKSKLNFS